MSTPRTLEQLREAVRLATDSKGSSALARHPDTELTDAINRGRNAFFVLVSQCNGGDRAIVSATINTVNGIATYALPTGFDRLVSADVSVDGFSFWLQTFQHEERGDFTSPVVSYGAPIYYQLQGDSIELLPTPKQSYAVTLRYVPTPTDLSLPSSSFDTILRLGEEYATYWAARVVKESTASWDYVDRYTARLQEIEAKVITEVRMRQGAPARIVDSFSRGRRPNRWPI